MTIQITDELSRERRPYLGNVVRSLRCKGSREYVCVTKERGTTAHRKMLIERHLG